MNCVRCGKETKNPKFCSLSCAASFNNRLKPKKIKTFVCAYCNKEFITTIYGKQYKRTYCSVKCSQEGRIQTNVNNWKNGSAEYGTKGIARNYLLKVRGGKCEKCGWDEKNPQTNKPPLELHHKDGNTKNNNESNLEILCPNCHSLTPTYRNVSRAGYQIRRRVGREVRQRVANP